MSLRQYCDIHFVGIKGVGMTALAVLAQESGKKVSGSDTEEIFPTDKTLKSFQIRVQKGFSPRNISKTLDLVVYTGAHQGIDNVEVQEAIRLRIPVMPHGKALGLFMEGKRGITVAGSHGKTTTSALIAHLLMGLKKDPSFAVGCGEILSLKTSGHFGKGEYFVAEGDEYVTDPQNDPTPRFMWQKPEVLIITNIDFDHPDVYKDLESVKGAFVNYANSLSPEAIIAVNIDDCVTASIIPQLNHKIVTFGRSKSADFRLQLENSGNGKTDFYIFHKNLKLGRFSLGIPGIHNCLNAAAAISALLSAGFAGSDLIQPLKTFLGTKRRFECIGEKNDKLLFDDYAHHPVEIAATLKACKEWYPNHRLLVIFQPHTYSRTKVLINEFAKSFLNADIVVLTEIYASAREKPNSGFNGYTLYESTIKNHPLVNYSPHLKDVLQYLRRTIRPKDLVLTMGAGDIYNWLPEILETF